MEKNIVLNNFDGNKIITSYDADKVWAATMSNGRKVFCKKKIAKEIETNMHFLSVLSGKKIYAFGMEFEISVPFIYDWNDETKVLTMEYCDGINLEFVLRNEETYNFGVKILNELLKLFIDEKIYWIDFAPRNVLLTSNKIKIVDFEKGLGLYSNEVEYLRNHVYEEYGSFSFMNDRMYMPDEIFDLNENEEEQNYYIPEIGPRRIKAVAKLLGYRNYLTKREYLQILKMFIIAEEPKMVFGKFIFPRVSLEKILKDKEINPVAFDNYALEVLRINQDTNNPFVKKFGR